MTRNRLIPFLLIFSLLINCYFFITWYRNQIVIAVPDGDSLDLLDGRRIRLLGTDAPERGRCHYQESRDRLASLTLGKRVTLRDIVKDDYGRQLADVFVSNQLINQIMVDEGMSRYTSVNSTKSNLMKEASDKAKSQKLGIFSSICRSETAPNLQCPIKGNNRDGNLTYHLPGCKNYDQTIVDLSYGDQWFCSEDEAEEAGFVKANGCK